MHIERGMQVRIEFDDHAEGERCIRFFVYGRVARVSKKEVTIHGWAYRNRRKTADENVQMWTLARAAIRRIVLLKDVCELE